MNDIREEAEQLKRFLAEEEAKNNESPEKEAISAEWKDESADGTDAAPPMPAPLRRRQTQQILSALAIGVASILCAVCFKQLKFLSFFLLGLYFVALAFLLEYDWTKGNVLQIVAACTHVISKQRVAKIICRDTENVYDFLLPARKSEFAEGYVYAIWVRRSEPKTILAYQPL